MKSLSLFNLKYSVAFVLCALSIFIAFAVAKPVAAQSTTDLQQQISILRQQVAALQSQLQTMGMVESATTSSAWEVPVTREEIVNHLYRCVLERSADPSGFDRYMNSNDIRDWQSLYLSFFDSREYKNKNKSNADFVEQVYNCVLFRDADAGGKNIWVNTLNRNQQTRNSVVSGFIESSEFVQNIKPALAAAKRIRPTEEWVPNWIDQANLDSENNWDVVDQYACNSNSLTAIPTVSDKLLGRYPVGATDSQPCQTPWSLTTVNVDWDTNDLTLGEPIINIQSGKQLRLGDGAYIAHAYDPVVTYINGENWVTFECAIARGNNAGAGTCAGPLQDNLQLDISRTGVLVYPAIYQEDGQQVTMSASVPKILNHEDKLYLYWVAVKYLGANQESNWVNLQTYGVEVEINPITNRLVPLSKDGERITTPFLSNNDNAALVYGVVPGDDGQDRVADLMEVVSDNGEIYFTAVKGGGDCVSPNYITADNGCYKMVIGKTNEPLAFRTFNRQHIPDEYLPQDAVSYMRFYNLPDSNQTVLMGEFFELRPNGTHTKSLKRIDWPLYFEQKTVAVEPTPTPEDGQTDEVASSRYPETPEAFITHLYQCVLGRSPSDSEISLQLNNFRDSSFYETYNRFFGSREYGNKRHSNSTYIGKLYECVLFRTATSQEISSWANQLQSGTITRTQALSQFVGSREFEVNVYPVLNPLKYQVGEVLGVNMTASVYTQLANALTAMQHLLNKIADK